MTEDEERQEKRGFKVEDRRRFSESGDVRPEHQEAAAPPPPPETATATAAPSPEPTREHAAFVELNFSTFLLSLTTQALAHLGEIPDPVTQRVDIDLQAAKQMIDILGILQEKTKGNLEVAESELLENALYDLRLRYVERARAGTQRA